MLVFYQVLSLPPSHRKYISLSLVMCNIVILFLKKQTKNIDFCHLDWIILYILHPVCGIMVKLSNKIFIINLFIGFRNSHFLPLPVCLKFFCLTFILTISSFSQYLTFHFQLQLLSTSPLGGTKSHILEFKTATNWLLRPFSSGWFRG